jgi:hypothetical protein
VYTAWYVPGKANMPTPAACGSQAAAAGAQLVYWRTVADEVWFVCMWPQYDARSADSTQGWSQHGWYYGIPWKTDGTGAPRDVYLRLDTISYDELVRRYRPVLKFDLSGEYWNASPATLTDHWENKLMRRQTPSLLTLFEHAGEGNLTWGLETLVAPEGQYPQGLGPPSDDDLIDAQGDHKDAADAFRLGPYDNTAYVHLVYDSSGKLWLQYWSPTTSIRRGPPRSASTRVTGRWFSTG